METIGTRELKQNPQAVISRVLETGEPIEITVYGRPTGVRLSLDEPRTARWVSGAALRMPPLTDAEREAWHRDLEPLREEEGEPVDPWEGRS